MKFRALLVLVFLGFAAIAGATEKHVLLTSLSWEPYVGPDLQDNGYVAEIVRESFARSGYSTEIVFYPWARAVHTAEYGRADGVFPEYYDESRKERFIYSDPFPGGPVGLYKRKDTRVSYRIDPRVNQTEALRDLKEYHFGIVRKYINTIEFDNAHFLYKEEASSDELNIKKLYNRRIHFMFIDKFVAGYLIRNRFPQYESELEFMEPPLEHKMLFIAFSRQAEGYEEKLAAFNAGLERIIADGTLNKIMERHGFSPVRP